MSQPRLRKPRFIRSDAFPPLAVTERDVRILSLIERHRFARSDHVCAAVGGSCQHLTRRLGRLYHAGLLERPRAQLLILHRSNTHFAYCITAAGQSLLRERGLPTFASPPRARGETMALSLSHSLRVTDVMLALERSASAVGATFLHHDQWRTDSEESTRLSHMRWSVTIRYDGKRVRCAVLPDGAFALDRAVKRSYFLVEVDRGTMPVSRGSPEQTSFRRKVLAYKATRDAGVLWKRHDIAAFRVLVVTASAARLRRMRETAADHFNGGASRLFYFATASRLHVDGIPSWQTCDGRTAESLTSPHATLQAQQQQRCDAEGQSEHFAQGEVFAENKHPAHGEAHAPAH